MTRPWNRSNPRFWRPHQELAVVDDYFAGVTTAETARRLGKTPAAVSCRRRALGLTDPTERPLLRQDWIARKRAAASHQPGKDALPCEPALATRSTPPSTPRSSSSTRAD